MNSERRKKKKKEEEPILLKEAERILEKSIEAESVDKPLINRR